MSEQPPVTWACDDCGWPWPLSTPPSPTAECDACGGPLIAQAGAPRQGHLVVNPDPIRVVNVRTCRHCRQRMVLVDDTWHCGNCYATQRA